MKSLVTLFRQVLDDVGDFCSVDTSRDFKTVTTRFENEGFEFFTRTLPLYGTGLEKSLDAGQSSPSLYPGFRCAKRMTPNFLGAFMDLIFDPKSGTVLDNPSIEAIRSVRQLTLLFKKIELDCGPERTAKAFGQFVQSNSEVLDWEKSVSRDNLDRFDRMADILFIEVAAAVNNKVSSFDLHPSHGPGATADRLVGNAKFALPMWTHRLESVAPYWRYASFFGEQAVRSYPAVDFRDPGNELPVRVISVPKTLETPRIIAIEPTCMQYMQQAVASALKTEIDSTSLGDLIGTTYQEPNQLLALQGSIDGSLATLDLSEASDRVSNLLVKRLFRRFPDLNDLVQASRSLTADVPGYGNIPLHRFASMGSALTFPIETMVFLIVTMIGIEEAYGTTVRYPLLKDWVGKVRIYGDDIIVPVDTVSSVIRALNLYGFKVNEGKSFWNGNFRESCGKEYYAGEDVTISRVRRPLPSSRKSVEEVISAVEFRNHAYKRGLWKTARYLDDFLSKILPLPAVTDQSTVLGRISFLGYDEEKMCPKLHRPMVKGAVVKYHPRFSPIDGGAALLKCLGFRFTGRPFGPFNELTTEVDHLQFAGRPIASSINYRWGYPV